MSAYVENTSSFKNKIINGDLRIDQRLAGVAQVYSSQSSSYVADRFKFGIFGSGYVASSVTTQKISTDYPPGATNSLKISTTVGMTIAVSDTRLGGFLAYAVEGLDTTTLDWGKSTAKKVTISFWVKANKTGTISVELENSGTTMTYSTTVTILVANTWEKKTVTIAGPTSGTWLTDTGIGLQINIGLFTNQNWLYGAVTGSWNANRYIFNTAQTNFLSTAGDAIYFGNFQFELGDTATDFESRPYQIELAMCQRYYEQALVADSSGGGIYGVCKIIVAMTTTALPGLQWRVQKRVTPTTVILYSRNNTANTVSAVNTGSDITGVTMSNISAFGCQTIGSSPAGFTTGLAYEVYYTCNADF
jgi:hypothetical protein